MGHNKRHSPHHTTKRQATNHENHVANNNNDAKNNHIAGHTPGSSHFWLFPALSRRTRISILVAVAVLCFSNNVTGDFVFDDNEAIINNKDVTADGVPLWKLFEHDFWGSKISSNTSHKSYRPLTVLSFRWNYQLAGGLHPTGFHVVNICLHAAVCALLYLVLVELTREMENTGSAAFLCSLLFATHPIHTECVSGIVGRAELLCGLFFLLALYSYIRGCYSDGALETTTAVTGSCLLCVVAVLCKEQGITVLGICSAYDVLLYNKLHPFKILGRLPSLLQSKSGHRLFCRHLALFVTGVMTLTFRWKVMGSETPVFHEVDNPQSFVDNTVLRVLNYNYLYAINAWLCLCPYWLCFDWSMGCVPVVTSLFDARLLAVFVLWAWLIAVIYWCLAEPITPSKRLVLMALAITIVPFLPASNLVFRVGFVVAERVLYLPSIGVCLLLTVGIVHTANISPRLDKVCSVLFVILLGLYATRSVQRSADWSNELRLFESAESVCPLNAKVHYNVAKVHADAGNTDYALEKYRLAVKLNPEYDQAMNNLANVLKERGENVEAEELLLRAVAIRPDFAAAWMNLGIVQATLGKIQASELSYLTALQHRARYPDCYYNLGNLYLDLERYTDALTAWRNATLQKPGHVSAWLNMLILLDNLVIDRTAHVEFFALTAWRNATLQKPGHVSAWLNMLILLDNLGRYADLEIIAQEALQQNPDEPALHYNLANALGKAGQNAESEKHFLKAIALNPNQASYHANLGVLYHRWGRLADANKAYTRALDLNPTDTTTQGYQRSVRNKLKAGAGGNQ